MKMIHEKAIETFKAKLEEMYEDRLAGVVLYGSCARGEEDEDSDIDILILLKDVQDFWEEVARISELETLVHQQLDYQVLISAIPVRIGDYKTKNIPIFMNVRKEGILV